MAEFLSAEWISALDAAARESTALAACAGDASFVLEQRVERPGGEMAVHHLLFAADGARVLPGRAAQADVVLSTDLATAVALARGELNAQGALVAGRLRVSGEVEALTTRAEALRTVDDVFARVRDQTTYPSEDARPDR